MITSRTAPLVLAAGLLGYLVPVAEPPPQPKIKAPAAGLSYLDNGVIRLGVDLDLGGTISYLADATRKENVINTYDLGRRIAQSYYSGPRPFGRPHPKWPDWPWNPVNAGDAYGYPATVQNYTNDGKTLYVRCTPRQWALEDVPGDCTFETWITLEGNTARVKNRLTNRRADHTQYRAMDQELPAAYTVGKLHRLFTYDGDQPFTDAPLRLIPPQPPRNGKPAWVTFYATENWAALVNDADWGMGIFIPGVVRFLGGFSGGKPGTGGPADKPTGYLAPVRKEVLDHNIVYEYEYVLILDALANIRRYARTHRPPSPLPDYRFTRDRQHWWFVRATDEGFPVKDHLRVHPERRNPQMVGPEACWDAREVPKLYVRAAYHTGPATAELFWRTKEQPTFDSERRVAFPVRADGQWHTYEVDLSRSPAYRGTILGLRFDPVKTGEKGDFIDVAFISRSRE